MVLFRHLLSEIFGRFDCTWVDIFNGRFHKPRQSEKLKENDISAVMEEAHDSAEEGEIYDEGVRDDIP